MAIFSNIFKLPTATAMEIGRFELLIHLDEEKAALLKPNELKRFLHLATYGLNGRRNMAIAWMSFGSALRVLEVARLISEQRVQRIMVKSKMSLVVVAHTKKTANHGGPASWSRSTGMRCLGI